MATLTLSVTVPDAHAAAILADFCAYHGYVAGAQTKAQFAKAVIARFVKECVKAQRASAAAEAARAAQVAEVDALVIT